MLRGFNAFMKAVNRICELFTALCLAVMTATIFFQVACRFFGTGYDFTEELARYLLVAVVILGAGIGVHRGGGIGIETVVNAVPPAWRRRMLLLSDLLCLLLFFEIIRHTWRFLPIAGRQSSPSMEISMLYPYSFIFAGVIIIFLHILAHCLDLTFGGQEKERTKNAA